MTRASRWTISLAAKCRLLFGSAVLLIIAAALFMPWLRMRDLVHESHLHTARLAGRLAIARVGRGPGDWEPRQAALANWWPTAATEHGFDGPVPELIALSDPDDPRPPPDVDAFTHQAISGLIADPTSNEAPPSIQSIDDNTVLYRVVLAIRSRGDRHLPGSLLGVMVVDFPARRAHPALWTNLALSLMAGALSGILAVLVFYLITQRLILSPVRELTLVAEGVSQGNHGIRSQIATGDEFEELARAFNAMLAYLQSSENELRTINRSLDTRLGKLAERNVALFESNKLKSQFLANVSHELRTPLTSIIGFAELLREASLEKGGRVMRYSENIMSSGRMLLGMINDLLDLAKIEAGRLVLHLATVDLRILADNLIDFMQPLADKKQLRLSRDVDEDLPTIVTDSGRLQQILYNLLSNALKFTEERDSVELTIRKQSGNGIEIAVRDTGAGIPPDQLVQVFEKFRQLDESMTRAHGGSGLGLAISRELVTLLGGAIRAESEVGRGSTFTITLPLHAPEEAPSSEIESAS